MKGELIKRGEGDYKLFVNDTPFGQSKQSPYNKLSLKNCKAIENGYDLDELAHKEYLLHENNDELYGDSLELRLAYKAGVYDGLKRMLTVLGDKKFSEEDIIIAMTCMQGQEVFYEKTYEETQKSRESYIKNYIQSLQQTEWDVEIVTKPYTEVNEGFELESKREVKLDANGCLILRRI